MYRLLLVDDEREVIEYFYRIFEKRSGLPLEIYTANSAQEALDCLNRIRVDIVLSDIKMPRMNGIQMYRIIKERWPRCCVIFLSGVLDFEYVYASIQERNVLYLTKLEPPEKIIETVRQSLDEIEEEYRRNLDAQKIQTRLQEALPLLQEQCVSNILSGILIKTDEIRMRLQDLSIPLCVEKEVWLVGGMFGNSSRLHTGFDFQSKALQLRTLGEELFGEYFDTAWHLSEQYFFCLAPSKY